MSTHNFEIMGAYSSISAQATDGGDLLISQTCYPLSSMFAIPMNTAVKLANDILEIANAQIKEAA